MVRESALIRCSVKVNPYSIPLWVDLVNSEDSVIESVPVRERDLEKIV